MNEGVGEGMMSEMVGSCHQFKVIDKRIPISDQIRTWSPFLHEIQSANFILTSPPRYLASIIQYTFAN